MPATEQNAKVHMGSGDNGREAENDDNCPSVEMFSSANVEGVRILKTFSDQVPTSQVNFSKTTVIYCGIAFLSAGITIPKNEGQWKNCHRGYPVLLPVREREGG